MKQFIFILFLALLGALPVWAEKRVFDMAAYAGILPDAKAVYDNSSRLSAALDRIRRETRPGDEIVLRFRKGRYDFYATDARRYDLYISNHDNPPQRAVGFMLNDFEHLQIEGGGADFVFHGRMIPFYLERVKDGVIRDLSIDAADPQICQVEVVSNSEEQGICFCVPSTYNYRVDSGRFFVQGLDWQLSYATGIAFEGATRHMVYRTSDLGIDLHDVQPTEMPRTLLAPHWKDRRLLPGTRVALRDYGRPCPGIVLDACHNIALQRVKVHYAEGMGLIAQLSENISLRQFDVCLRGKDDPRYFTTQADATHFSQCRGHIESTDGLYEGMMDDAINIHGIYLKARAENDRTLLASFEHGQCYGLQWGAAGDTVSFLLPRTMERVEPLNRIRSIRPADRDDWKGTKTVRIELEHPLPPALLKAEAFGIENESWTPTARFARSIVRNNRARGALFSSPRRTVCEDNLFDHVSGTAILLCGDCNGWYESGPVRDLVIRRNKFVNALTNLFQFTNAVISIYPEIPDLALQQSYFHGGRSGAIRIENNEFRAFDTPLLYAKSVNGLVFRRNTLHRTTDYAPFHPQQQPIVLERVIDAQVETPK